MRGVRTLGITLLAAALCALALAACGGGSDSTDSTAATTTETTTGSSGGGGGSGQAGHEGGGGGSNESEDSGGGSGSSSGSGSKSDEGSAEFRVKGGDNSIQDYGDEAPPSERKDAEAALVAYMDARAKRDWAKACPHLAKSAVAPIEQLAKQSKEAGEGCAGALALVTKAAPAEAFVNTLTGPVASLRVQGNRAFVLYHGPNGNDFFVPMVKEGGAWKVATISPSEFPY